MLTWGSKFFLALVLGTLVGAVIYGLVTGGGPIGVISSGYKGGVGDHLGYAVLLFAALALSLLALVTTLVRDGDAEVMAARAGVATVPPVAQPNDASYWGPITGFGVAAVAIGLAVSPVFWIFGLAVLSVAALMWTVLAWSDRATGDPEINRLVRQRVLGPVEIPMLSLLGIGAVAVGASRIFLASGKVGAVVAGSIITLFIFGAAILMSKVELKRSAVTGLVTIGALAILGGGIIGAAVGPAELHHGDEHGEEHGDEEHSEEGDG